MKALAEEVKMVYLVAATVVQVVVEMVEKFGGEMGSMVFHGGKEEGGGMEVLLLLLEMEEEMEKGMLVGFGEGVVEEMVEKFGGEMEKWWPAKGEGCCLLSGNGEGKKSERMKKREGVGVFI